MQPNLLRNLCFLPTKNTKYRTFYRTHFLLISITCLSRYISLSFYRPALAHTYTLLALWLSLSPSVAGVWWAHWRHCPVAAFASSKWMLHTGGGWGETPPPHDCKALWVYNNTQKALYKCIIHSNMFLKMFTEMQKTNKQKKQENWALKTASNTLQKWKKR